MNFLSKLWKKPKKPEKLEKLEKEGIKLRVAKITKDAYGFTNRVYVHPKDIDAQQIKHIDVQVSTTRHLFFTIANDLTLKRGKIGFNMYQRQWADLTLDQIVTVSPKSFEMSDPLISSIVLTADFSLKKNQTTDPLDSDQMAREFLMQYSASIFSEGQEFVFKHTEKKKSGKDHQLKLIVRSLEGAVPGQKSKKIEFGFLNPNASVVFDKPEESVINFTGSSKGKPTFRILINPEWDLEKMGIGGLDKEISTIFRRAFASRLYASEYIEKVAMKHVRGILLYGPPGTGKTLIVRQIGKMFNVREPKIVSGPDILNQYVSKSKEGLQKLFADAEEEWKRCGANSGLHIIIFDQLDAMCKKRGSIEKGAEINDMIVSQLLVKMDRVGQLNNVLVIGTTNRKDMIDEALLRPGRFEVQLEISLPDEVGRSQILKIHTSRLREFKKLGADVDLTDLAKRTKNFSGAELEGLVRAAQSFAMNRMIEVDPDAIRKFIIGKSDFEYALEHDVKPALGIDNEKVDRLLRGDFIGWDTVSDILQQGKRLVARTLNSGSSGFVKALLTGPAKCGKTYLAAKIAKDSDFPFIKVVTSEDMVGFSESMKCHTIKKIFEDSYRSPHSIVIVDNIERLVGYSPIEHHYSNMVLETLLVFFDEAPPKKCRLMILATSSNQEFLNQVGMVSLFTGVIEVPAINTIDQILKVLEESNFSKEATEEVSNLLRRSEFNFHVGIKKLLDLVEGAKQFESGKRAERLVNALGELTLDSCDLKEKIQ